MNWSGGGEEGWNGIQESSCDDCFMFGCEIGNETKLCFKFNPICTIDVQRLPFLRRELFLLVEYLRIIIHREHTV